MQFTSELYMYIVIIIPWYKTYIICIIRGSGGGGYKRVSFFFSISFNVHNNIHVLKRPREQTPFVWFAIYFNLIFNGLGVVKLYDLKRPFILCIYTHII